MNGERFRDQSLIVPRGFRAGAVAAGIKPSGRPDLALFVSDRPCSAAGLFTRCRFAAAPVIVCREHLAAGGSMRAIIVNAGNANACTGETGRLHARRMAQIAAALIQCTPEEVLPASTGVIGRPLPIEKIEAASARLAASLEDSPAAATAAAHAMMTTDAFPKWATAEIQIEDQTVRLLGLAKGAGMIHPDLATMLVFLLTDAAVDPRALHAALTAAADASFHCLTVDGDTSTNDTVIALANGAAGTQALTPEHPQWDVFQAALAEVCKSLARQIAADGEGAHHLVQITVSEARDVESARRVAMTVALSPLVKTAICGNDPNWGRIIAAVGRSPAEFRPENVRLALGGIALFERGAPLDFDPAAVADYMRSSARVDVEIALGAGPAQATVWTSDLTPEYVHINSEYTT
ncbi:MAG: bifunctional glutamate N-acetyltransferase/amino-acid acetyltransferase ArgJ [Candidatus Sumerlaeia bacterium]